MQSVRAAALALAFLSPLAAQSSTDDVARAIAGFDAVYRDPANTGKMTLARLHAIADEALEQLDATRLTVDDWARLDRAGVLHWLSDAGSAVDRIETLAAPRTVDGARAAAIAALVAARHSEMASRAGDLLARAVEHDQLGRALVEGRALDVFTAISVLPEPERQRSLGSVLALADALAAGAALPATTCEAAANLVIDLAAVRDVEGRVVERLRRALLAAIDALPGEASARLEPTRRLLRGAFARRALLGCAAPDFSFVWKSAATGDAQKLSDFRGRAVLLAYWATWCGPCIAELPMLRSLQERYAQRGFVVVSVTGKAGLAPDAAQESPPFASLADFVAKRRMTWPVVVSERDAFDPELGIQGLPYLALLDAEGIVRRAPIPYGTSEEEIAGAIEALLPRRPAGPSALATLLREEVPPLLAAHHVPGIAIVTLVAGEIDTVLAFGRARADAERAMTADTPGNVASVSKSFTAALVLRLAERGLVDLDAPVFDVVKRWRPAGTDADLRGITARRLLQHTAGLSGSAVPWFDPAETAPSLEATLTGAAGPFGPVVLAHPPGERHEYSGAGYSVLQLLCEAATDRSFADAMRDEVLRPLGTHASYEFDRAADAAPHDRAGALERDFVYPGLAAAGLRASARDLALFLRNIWHGLRGEPALLTPQTLAAMTEPAVLCDPERDPRSAYGLGCHVCTEDGERSIFHWGTSPGWRAYYWLRLTGGDGIAVVLNGEDGEAVFERVFEVWKKSN